MKKIIKLLTSKLVLAFLSLILQIAIFVVCLMCGKTFLIITMLILWIFSLFLCIFIANRDQNPSYKLAWIIIIIAFPIFGGTLYMLFGFQNIKKPDNVNSKCLNPCNNNAINESFPAHYCKKISDYIEKCSGFPCYRNTHSTFYNSGEAAFEAIKNAMKNARHYIFIEFFTIGDGQLLDEFIDIMSQKPELDIRIIYDDVGSLFTLSEKTIAKLRSLGIKIRAFNPIRPTLDGSQNNRTHRKIIIVDNKAFSGGYNLCDEYANKIDKFGYWRDYGISTSGNATKSFLAMFLDFWEHCGGEKDDGKYFGLCDNLSKDKTQNTDGYIQPLCGEPNNTTPLFENVFLQMINSAIDHIYINAPYLILNNEILTALCMSAKSGVDIKIIMPHIPDKKFVFLVSRSFYPTLIKAGVKIYEFMPGFNHAKSIEIDEKAAFIGSCNFDYRSFYRNYECGAMLYNSHIVKEINEDFLQTIDKCHQISLFEAENVSFLTKFGRLIARLIAPLL